MAETSTKTGNRTAVLTVGTKIDNDLTVVDHLGGSRTVDVYLCKSKSLKKLVSCKVLRPSFRLNFRTLQAVLEEGTMLMGLHHPNVVEVYSVELEVHPRVVMEYLRGQTLSATFLEGNFEAYEVADIADVAVQIADALDYIHTQGILHLDVKPSNVMYHNGHATLIDFSVAEEFSPDKPLKDNAGTRRYMAPEQTERQEVGYATDVYGLGVLFYQLLTGGALPYGDIEVPDRKNEGKTLRVVDYATPPAHPSDLNPAVPRRLGDVALTAISTEKRERYPSAGDLKKAILKASRKLG